MNHEYVSNIQRFSLDDGPGIRTTVFLKGCNLQCQWCHNPESISFSPVLQFISDNCVSCGKCVAACPGGAHLVDEKTHVIDRTLCQACGACAQRCRKNALKLIGTKYSARQVFNEILKDRAYYEVSGGGVTFSGGEPACKPDFVVEVARMCADAKIHVTLDTAGNVPFESFETLLPHVSLFLYDVKCVDHDLHKRGTGVGNDLILENLKRLDRAGAGYRIRVPVIPGFNNDPGEQKAIAGFLSSLCGPQLVELLPYHGYGVGKYEILGLDYTCDKGCATDRDFMEKALQYYLELGLKAQIS